MDWVFLLIIVALLLFMLLKCHPAPCESDRIVHLIDELREHEGATVEILCDNPEPETRQDQAGVIITDDWTDWQPRRFDGETVLDCLQKAKVQRELMQTIETVMHEQNKKPLRKLANCSFDCCPDYHACIVIGSCLHPK